MIVDPQTRAEDLHEHCARCLFTRSHAIEGMNHYVVMSVLDFGVLAIMQAPAAHRTAQDCLVTAL